MNHIGHKIKYYRLKKGLTQYDLSNGILSYSYLSKIENGNAKPGPEIVGLLCKKLNISPQVLTELDTSNETCKKWFKSLLLGDRKKSTELYREINSNTSIFSNESLLNLIELNELRYFLLTKQVNKTARQLRVLERKSSKFNKLEQYYFYKFSGEYFYSKNAFRKAFERFQVAESLISNDMFFKAEEESDLFYLIGITASKIRQVHIALNYASKALHYHQSQYNLFKCAQCHILLGISYRRFNEHKKSIQSYEMAIKIGESLGKSNLVSLSYQNIGALYTSIGESSKAIKYYKKCFELQFGNDTTKLLSPIVCLIREYYQIGDYSNSSYWLQQGLTIIESLETEETIDTFDIKVYEQLLTQQNSPNLEKLILTIVIPFLEKNQLEYQKHIYYQILAEFYYRMRRYKSSADYYDLANQILKSIYNG